MLYTYTGVDKNTNKETKGKIEADSEKEARAVLSSQNILVLDLKKKEWTPEKLPFFRKSIKPLELAMLSRDFSVYLKSGIPIANAIKLAKSQYSGNGKIFSMLSAIEKSISEGKSFYKAIESQSVFKIPTFYKMSIKVAEEGGTLQTVLSDLSEFLQEQDRVSKQIKRASAYPLFIAIASTGMILFILSYVVPQITDIFRQTGQELPKITSIVIETGSFVSENFTFIALILIAIFTIPPLLKRKSEKISIIADSMLLRLPVFGKIIKTWDMAMFSSMVSMLVKSGIPFAQAIKLSSSAIKNDYLRKIFEQASEKVVEGSKFSSALAKERNTVGNSFIQAIAIGEETSEVQEILKNLSEMYREENRNRIETALSLMEPALMLLVGGFVGLILASMLLPIFSIDIGGGF